jgi:DNA mismatch repair protein MutS2
VGAIVRHRTLGWQGTLEKLAGGRAEVAAGGKRLRCRAEELVAIAAPQAVAKSATIAVQGARGRGKSGPHTDARPAPRTPEAPEVPPELMLIGERAEPALERLDGYLDEALHAGRDEVRVVHGHGSGRLRSAVREHLSGHRAVASWRPGEDGEGGNGATVVRLRG